MSKITIGDNFKLIKKSRHLTLSGISKMTGIQIATLSRIQNNRMTGTLDSHAAIANALEVPLSDLYREIPPASYTPTNQNTSSSNGFSVLIKSNGIVRKNLAIEGKNLSIIINGETKISIEKLN